MKIDIQEVGPDYCCGTFSVDHRTFGFAFHPIKQRVWTFDPKPNKFEKADFKARLVAKLFEPVDTKSFDNHG